MHTSTHADHPAGSLPPPETTPDLIETGTLARPVQPGFAIATVDERAALRLAALEELELRRAALERLLDDDLLWRCLV